MPSSARSTPGWPGPSSSRLADAPRAFNDPWLLPAGILPRSILEADMDDHDQHVHGDPTPPAAPEGHDAPSRGAGHEGHGAAEGHDQQQGHDAGHDRHEGHSVAMFRDRFWLSLALTIPVVILSPDIQHWLGSRLPTFPGDEYAAAILGTIVFLYGGLVFLRGARGELADRQPGMMTLISLAILVAFVTSWAGTLGLFEVEIWWELATLI